MGRFSELRERGGPRNAQALLELVPYARFLGIRIEGDVDTGLRVRLPFRPELVGNPALPALHGGVIGAFLETTAIGQLLWEGDGERVPKPVDLTIDYLRSAGPHDTFARATITKHGRRIANVRAEAWQDDPARPVAAAHGHFLLPPPRES